MRNTTRANVRTLLALALPAIMPAFALAEPLTLEAQPTVVAEAPTADATASVANPLAEAKPANGKILVLPFQAVNPNDPAPWLGKSIQESMVADLTVAAPDRAISTDKTAPTLDAAIGLGKEQGARYVVAGGFITVDRELRVTGQVVDVETGKSVAGLKATGDPAQIFHMEDALALQVRAQVLGQQVAPMQPVPVEQQQAPAPVQAAAPAPDVMQPADPGPQYTSSYAAAPTQVVYGGDPSAYSYYYPSAYSGYDPYYYPAYGYYGPSYYCNYGFYGGCYPFGFGIGFCFGSCCFHNHFDFHGGNDFHSGFHSSFAGGSRSSFSASANFGGSSRSAASFHGSVGSSSSFARSPARVTSGAPFRSSSMFQSSSFGHASSIGGFHAGGGFSSHASFGGGGSFGGGFHGGGGGGGGHGGGGHR